MSLAGDTDPAPSLALACDATGTTAGQPTKASGGAPLVPGALAEEL